MTFPRVLLHQWSYRGIFFISRDKCDKNRHFLVGKNDPTKLGVGLKRHSCSLAILTRQWKMRLDTFLGSHIMINNSLSHNPLDRKKFCPHYNCYKSVNWNIMFQRTLECRFFGAWRKKGKLMKPFSSSSKVSSTF